MNIKNKSGSKTEPCGAPYFTEALLETTINGNKLFSANDVGFETFICDTMYVKVQALLARYHVQQYQNLFANQQKYHNQYFLYLRFS